MYVIVRGYNVPGFHCLLKRFIDPFQDTSPSNEGDVLLILIKVFETFRSALVVLKYLKLN